jgi:hypothetical protein
MIADLPDGLFAEGEANPRDDMTCNVRVLSGSTELEVVFGRWNGIHKPPLTHHHQHY